MGFSEEYLQALRKRIEGDAYLRLLKSRLEGGAEIKQVSWVPAEGRGTTSAREASRAQP